MRSIQEVGIEILGGNPSKFYVLCGNEWGIKKKYISSMEKVYEGRVKNCSSAKDVLSYFKKKQLIALPPCLYVVRYDEEYLASLTDASSSEIDKMNISGTVVLIYESEKHQAKVEKYLSNYAVSINQVAPEFVFKHLKTDFPSLDDNTLKLVQSLSTSYGECYMMCLSLSELKSNDVSSLDKLSLASLFGKDIKSNELEMKKAIASRNVFKMLGCLDSYNGDLSSLYYTFLSTCIDLERHLSTKYFHSDIEAYVNRWNISDIYFMFTNVYDELKKSRSSYSYEIASSLSYLCYLTQLDRIPEPGALR